MRHLFNKLNFSFKPLIGQHNLTMNHYRIPIIRLNPELTELLLTYDIKVTYAECFNRKPGGRIPIHNDHEQSGECVKINWIYGGQGSTMQWFSVKENVTGIDKVTRVNSKYVLFSQSDVEPLATLETLPEVPYLLQAGVPHTVFNEIEQRSCVSIVLYDMDNRHLSMAEALKRLENHIVT